ncbi:MAG: hypothetical protein NTV87_13220 [Ignavibacteriae bacterium]|nr:hypothetical protein [Ignavibacteriota bacterium]
MSRVYFADATGRGRSNVVAAEYPVLTSTQLAPLFAERNGPYPCDPAYIFVPLRARNSRLCY